MAWDALEKWDLEALDLRGPRGGLKADQAREKVSHVLSGQRTDYRRTILSTWGFFPDAAEVIASTFPLLPNLESVIMADIIAGQPEAVGLEVYRILGEELKHLKLKELDISDNAVGPKGLKACEEFLVNQPDLERFFVSNCGMSAEAMRYLADILLTDLPKKFKVLHFHSNMCGGAGGVALADIVSASPELLDFRFTSCRATRDGGVALAKAFRDTPKIRHINIQDNLLGECTGVELGKSLESLHDLVTLVIGDIILKDEGMQAVTAGLIRGCAYSLETLDVSANDLTETGAKYLAKCIPRLRKLRVLKLNENEIGRNGALALGGAIFAKGRIHNAIEEVHIQSNEIEGNGCFLLAMAVLSSCPALKVLDISGNELSEAQYRRLLAKAKQLNKQNAIVYDEEDLTDEAEDEDDWYVHFFGYNEAELPGASPQDEENELNSLSSNLSFLTL